VPKIAYKTFNFRDVPAGWQNDKAGYIEAKKD